MGSQAALALSRCIFFPPVLVFFSDDSFHSFALYLRFLSCRRAVFLASIGCWGWFPNIPAMPRTSLSNLIDALEIPSNMPETKLSFCSCFLWRPSRTRRGPRFPYTASWTHYQRRSHRRKWQAFPREKCGKTLPVRPISKRVFRLF